MEPRRKAEGERGIRIFKHILTLSLLAVLSPALAGQDLTFAIISDHRTEQNALGDALTFIDTRNADFVLVPGDLEPLNTNYPDYYAAHGYTVNGALAPDRQKAYFVLGNHDQPALGSPFFQTSIAPYYPTNGPAGSPAGTAFSFEWGNCHITVTNQYWDFWQGGYSAAQLAWLRADLQAAAAPLKIVVGHEPAFPHNRHSGDSLDFDIAMRDAFWEILVEEGVHVFICGHTHYYVETTVGGVLQIESGVVAPGQIDVTMAEITGSDIVLRHFLTNGAVPGPGDETGTIGIPSGHTLSGTVMDGAVPVAGIRVYAQNSRYGRSQADGSFTIDSLPDGAYYIVPTDTGLLFAPPSVEVTVAGVDITGLAFSVTADPDQDADLLADTWEVQYFGLIGNCIPGSDSDADGLNNDEEYAQGTDPVSADTDADGLNDGDEVNTHGTSPLDPDMDDDGALDGAEIAAGTGLFDPDSDDDGMPDGWELAYGLLPLTDDSALDLDSDGLPNLSEYSIGADPSDSDTDNDGLPDGTDPTPTKYGGRVERGSSCMPGEAGGAWVFVVMAFYCCRLKSRRPSGEAGP